MFTSRYATGPQAVIVFDTDALIGLARLRTPGRSWLELLEHTSELPTVSKVIIPSVCADLEARGRICQGKNAHGQWSWKNVNTRAQNIEAKEGKYFHVLNNFLEHACRNFMDKESPVHAPGRMKKIVIQDSAYGRAFLNNLLRIYHNHTPVDAPGSLTLADRIARIKDEYQNRNHGDQDLIECINALDHAGPVFVVTNDRRLARRIAAYPDQIHTQRGTIPKVYSLEEYLEAEKKARESAFPSGKKTQLQLDNEPALKKYPSFDVLIDRERRAHRWADGVIANIAQLQALSGADRQDIGLVLQKGLEKEALMDLAV